MKNYEYTLKKLDDLIPYTNNSRTHSDEQINQIASSIKEFGFTNPILIDEKCGVIAGHGRLFAAKKLNINAVPTIQIKGLTCAQIKAYVIADNKLALNAGWNEEMLRIEFEDLAAFGFDLNLTGFSLEEIEEINFNPDFGSGKEEDQGALDELDPKYVACPHCGKEFDLRDNK